MFRNIVIVTAFIFTSAGCTKDFQQINVNPNAPVDVPSEFLLSGVELWVEGATGDPGHKVWRSNFMYSAVLMQQMARLGGAYAGDKYFFDNEASGTYWNDSYPASIKNVVNLIEKTKEDTAKINILSIARILKAYEMQHLTDIYGDVPYFEAGLGSLKLNFAPVYDEQQKIYMDLLKELDEAGAALTTSRSAPYAADFIYGSKSGGSERDFIPKWKKFANSLMLRLAMRMQKVDPESAKTWAKKALDGGVISSNTESFAFLVHTPSFANPNSYNLGSDMGAGRREVPLNFLQWGKTLIDMMIARVDPRLPIIATLKNGDRTPANQKGLPNGLDQNLLKPSTGDTTLDNFSRPTSLMYKLEGPNYLLTYAEVKFLTAEAIERGWYAGNAQAEYQQGQEAALKQIGGYDPAAIIPDASIAAYQALNKYPVAGSLEEKLNQIHTEFYLLMATTFNHRESWFNWRRTGYPVLTPVNYTGNVTAGTIPRRLRYPQDEIGVNPNYKTASDRMGGDLFTSRVWWDKL